MNNNDANLKEKLKQALTSTIKVISEDFEPKQNLEQNENSKKNELFEIEFQETLNPKDYRDKQELSEKLNRVLEKMIIKNPDQWIWTHNRWK